MNSNCVFKSDPFSSFGFRSFVPLFSDGTFRGAFHSQGGHRGGASTLPRTKSRSTSALPVKPSITVSPAPHLDFPSALSAGRPKLSGSGSDPSPLDSPLSSTLPVPTLRLSPSPTSGCQGTYVDASGTRQPSPVARERRARSISITNANIEPARSREKSAHERENDVFASLKDVPHPALRGDPSRTPPPRHAALTPNASSLHHQKVDLVKNESSDLHKSKLPPRKTGPRTTLQPNLNSKQQLLPDGIPPTDVQRRSQLAFEARPTLPDPRGTPRTAAFGSGEPLQDHQRRHFSFTPAGNTDAPLQRPAPSSRAPQQPGAARNNTPPHARGWRPGEENADVQMDVEGVFNQSSGAAEERRLRADREARRRSGSGQTERQRGVFARRYQNTRAALTPGDTELNQPPECSPQSRVKNWPLSLEQRSHVQEGSGNASNGASDSGLQPQQGADQRAAGAALMASSSPNQPRYRRPGRVIFLEEDPYYVTMYHPGSVYVGE